MFHGPVGTGPHRTPLGATTNPTKITTVRRSLLFATVSSATAHLFLDSTTTPTSPQYEALSCATDSAVVLGRREQETVDVPGRSSSVQGGRYAIDW